MNNNELNVSNPAITAKVKKLLLNYKNKPKNFDEDKFINALIVKSVFMHDKVAQGLMSIVLPSEHTIFKRKLSSISNKLDKSLEEIDQIHSTILSLIDRKLQEKLKMENRDIIKNMKISLVYSIF